MKLNYKQTKILKKVKTYSLILFACFLIFVGILSFINAKLNPTVLIPKEQITGKDIRMNFTSLEVASTPELNTLGLSDRTELCNQCAMLFVIAKPEIRSFWMLRTYVAIDIIFLDDNFRVTDRYVKPLQNSTDKLYSSSIPVRFALEMPSTRAEELGIQKGDKLLFDIKK